MAWWCLECSPMAWKTWVQSQVESYQRLKKWYFMPPCLTLSIIRYESRVKWSNPGKGVAPSPTPWCSSSRKGSLLVTLDYSRQLYLLIYVCVCVCVCVWKSEKEVIKEGRFEHLKFHLSLKKSSDFIYSGMKKILYIFLISYQYIKGSKDTGGGVLVV